MKRFLMLIVAVGCGIPDGGDERTPDGNAGFTFRAVVRNIDASVTSVRFDGASYEVADHQVTITKEFATYSDGVAAGPLMVDFVSGGTVVQSGMVAVGACSSCAYDFCPALSELESEQIEYSEIGNVASTSFICFTCSGGGAVAKACP